MIEIVRLAELKALLETHKHSSPDLIERAYQVNREVSQNALEEHKERSILAAITKKRR
ncbi:MAG: hypothetical protein PHQ43_11235 [Dehalococcoidales bacterium]|nr:hypothetical protein [Dehalococcoidales bacterium]